MEIKASFNAKELERNILVEFAARLNSFMPGVLAKVPILLQRLIETQVKQSNDYITIVGKLYGELGVTNIEEALEDVISTIVANAETKFEKFKIIRNSITGSIEIGILKTDYNDILALPSVSFYTQKGFDIPWLEWLLLHGDSRVVSNYNFKMNSFSVKFSRTGTGIMVRDGQGWGVPSNVSGNANNNFLTRALEKIDEKIIQELYIAIGKL